MINYTFKILFESIYDRTKLTTLKLLRVNLKY